MLVPLAFAKRTILINGKLNINSVYHYGCILITEYALLEKMAASSKNKLEYVLQSWVLISFLGTHLFSKSPCEVMPFCLVHTYTITNINNINSPFMSTITDTM